MSIKFHCEHCGKRIQAADTAAGKWAKCPACHIKLQIPEPVSDEGEELKLAPINNSEVEKQKKLISDAYKLTQELLSENQLPDEPAGTKASDISEEQLTSKIIIYLRHLADGNLDEAEKLIKSIAPCGRRTVKILDKIALSEIPEPELADIPEQVLSSLIKKLRSKIKIS